MAHENDSFIREVNEELRSDRFRTAWSRYGKLVIGVAVLIVVGTASLGIYEYWNANRSSDVGDKFAGALSLASQKKPDEALAAFSAIEADAHGGYPALSRMRAATLQAEKGDTAAAVAAFNAVSKDSDVPVAVRDLARLRAGWLLIDTGSYEQVSAEVEALSGADNALRHSAREALGLAAYKAGDFPKAKDWFTRISTDASAPRNVSNRAQIMLDNIAASGKAP